METRLGQVCLETTLELTQRNDHGLVYWCVVILTNLKANDRMHVPSDTVHAWVAWLGTADCHENNKRYVFRLPKPTVYRPPVGNLFWIFNKATVRDQQRCGLCVALQPHSEFIQQAIIRGTD